MQITQKVLVLEYLKKNKSITSWEAIRYHRITRLASVIYDLRKEGYEFFVTKDTRGGKTWAKYILLKELL